MISYKTTLKFFTLLLNIMNTIPAFTIFAQGLFRVFWPSSFLTALNIENTDEGAAKVICILAMIVFGGFASIFGVMCLAFEIFGCYNIVNGNATNLKHYAIMQVVMFTFWGVGLIYAYNKMLIPDLLARGLLIMFSFMLSARLRQEEKN